MRLVSSQLFSTLNALFCFDCFQIHSPVGLQLLLPLEEPTYFLTIVHSDTLVSCYLGQVLEMSQVY